MGKRTHIIYILFLVATVVRAQHAFMLRHNLLYDLTLTPNISADVRIAPKWTMGMTLGYNPWSHSALDKNHGIFRRGDAHDAADDVQWRHLLVMPELRKWFGRQDPYSQFWGVNVLWTHYNVGNVRFPFGVYSDLRSKRRQGNAYAVGASYGRIWHLTGSLYLEGELGLDVGLARYTEYECHHCGEELAKDTKPFLLPKVGLSLVYAPTKKVEPVSPPVVQIDTVPEPFRPVLAVVPEYGGVAEALSKTYPVLRERSQYRPYDDTRILRKEEGALYVHFPVNKSDLRRDFRDNASVLDQIVDITRLIMADSTSSVSCIQIIGLASIEGRQTLNEQLSKARAQALKTYVQQHVDVPDSLFEAVSGGEAWNEFRDQVNDLKLALEATGKGTKYVEGEISQGELKEILTLIDTEPNLDRREQIIRDMRWGWTYKYLREHILADQRNSGYLRIYWDHVPDVKAQTINRASQLLQQGQNAEALRLMQTVKDDPRGFNTMAVALYQTGHKAEALEYFRRAAANGNTEARENLRRLGVRK